MNPMNNSLFKFIFLSLLLVPTFTFAQNLQINDPGLDSLINNSEPVITPMAGANAGNGLVPDSTPTNTGSTNTQGNTSGQIDTSILNQPAYNPPTVVPYDQRFSPENQSAMDSRSSTNLSVFDSIAPAATFGGQPLSNLLNQIFYIGLGIAVVLAIVMIVRGGIQYMTIDAASSKDSGKKMVQAAIGGLVLAFAGILILNTINPKLTELNLSFDPLRGITGLPSGLTSGTRIDPATGQPMQGPVNSQFTNAELEAYTLSKIKEMGFSNLNPADKAAFFPNGGTDEEWLALASAMIKNESGFDPNQTYTESFTDNSGKNVVSTGLFQLSQESARGYGFSDMTTAQLMDPKTNIDVGLTILKKWVSQDGYISGPNNTGGARYWSVLRPTGKLGTVKTDMQN
jgi:hypothetical protein